MNNPYQRRRFIKALASIPVFSTTGLLALSHRSFAQGWQQGQQNLKASLNAFSFNGPLSEGKMTIDELLQFSSRTGFDAVDITAYYFPGYPSVPPDDFLYEVKRKAFRLGLEISGTGVRNDFTHADKAKRSESIQLVKDWIVAAEKMGAPVIRIFAGTQQHKDHSRDQVTAWMIEAIRECVAFGKDHGVMIGLQNHNDFLQTAGQVIGVIEAVDSDWLGMILDTGSYRVGDPYDEIAKSIPYAINWQIKEKVFVDGAEIDTDMEKLMSIIRSSAYQGYLPIETLGSGDPEPKVIALLEKLKAVM